MILLLKFLTNLVVSFEALNSDIPIYTSVAQAQVEIEVEEEIEI